jgi:hypothetical protein
MPAILAILSEMPCPVRLDLTPGYNVSQYITGPW